MQLLLAFLPIALALYIYKDVGSYAFVWDDVSFIWRNPGLRSEEWTNEIWKALPFSDNYFRPLVLASFAFDLYVSNVSPAMMHWVNLAIHITNTLFIYFLADTLAKRKGISRIWATTIAATIYACHPAMIETTAWISGRFDQLCNFFMLASLLAASKRDNAPKSIILTSILFLCAALSKEIAAIFPAILLVWLTLLSSSTASLNSLYKTLIAEKKLFISIISTGVIYLLIRYYFLGYLTVNDALIKKGDSIQHLLLIGKTFLLYLRLSFWPFAIVSPFHESKTPIAYSDTEAWIGLAVLSFHIAFILYALKSRKFNNLVFFLVLYTIALAPLLHIIKPLTIGYNIGHERFLTFAISFVSLGTGFFVAIKASETLPIRFNPLRPIVILWIIWSFLNSSINVTFWRSNISLWGWASKTNPTSAETLNNLAAAYLEQRQFALAESTVNAALKLTTPKSHEYNIILANYANILKNTGYNQEALNLYLKIQKETGKSSGLSNNIGTALMALNRLEEAESYFIEAIALSPKFWIAIANLSRCKEQQGEHEQANYWLDIAHSLAPPGTIKITEAEGNSDLGEGN